MTIEPGSISGVISAGSVLSGRFEILHRIATGGTSSVYKAHALLGSPQTVAIKILHSSHHHDKQLVERFIQEAKLLNKLDHINIVKTQEIVIETGLIYLVTEFIEGQTLLEALAADTAKYETLANMIEQICNGLEIVHNAGILHRDLKPENILVQPDGILKIIDFGAARASRSRLTLAGQLIGTAPYIAPEVWIEKHLSPAIDFYSLGVILYQATTGKLPFATERTSDLMQQHLDRRAVPPQKLVPEVPEWLNALIMKLLEKNPQARYQSAQQVISFLRKSAENNFQPIERSSFRPIEAAVLSTSSRRSRRSERKRKKQGKLSAFLNGVLPKK